MGMLIIPLLLLALIFGPGMWVRSVLRKYSTPEDRYGGTGRDLARHLLDEQGLTSVKVETTQMGDHYDPLEKAVRLTPDKFDGKSLTAITVAAHEVGHAVQDQVAYAPLRLRTNLVRLAVPIQKIGAFALIVSPAIGLLTRHPLPGIYSFAIGFLILASSTIVHLVTLPTEFDASFGRALPLLERHNILIPEDKPHARRLLTAAAMTYVAASLWSLLNIARWIAILRR